MAAKNDKFEDLTAEELISEGARFQNVLFKIYKTSIESIHQLKQSSRINMELMADVEDDLSINEYYLKNIEALTNYISDFNTLMSDQIEGFEETVDSIHLCYSVLASKAVNASLTFVDLIKISKQLSFICSLINKYRFKVDNLKLMSNSMLYHSDDFEKQHQLYRSNLIALAVILTEAYEKFDELNHEYNQLLK